MFLFYYCFTLNWAVLIVNEHFFLKQWLSNSRVLNPQPIDQIWLKAPCHLAHRIPPRSEKFGGKRIVKPLPCCQTSRPMGSPQPRMLHLSGEVLDPKAQTWCRGLQGSSVRTLEPNPGMQVWDRVMLGPSSGIQGGKAMVPRPQDPNPAGGAGRGQCQGPS